MVRTMYDVNHILVYDIMTAIASSSLSHDIIYGLYDLRYKPYSRLRNADFDKVI